MARRTSVSDCIGSWTTRWLRSIPSSEAPSPIAIERESYSKAKPRIRGLCVLGTAFETKISRLKRARFGGNEWAARFGAVRRRGPGTALIVHSEFREWL